MHLAFSIVMPGAVAGWTMCSLEKREPFMRASCPGGFRSAKIAGRFGFRWSGSEQLGPVHARRPAARESGTDVGEVRFEDVGAMAGAVHPAVHDLGRGALTAGYVLADRAPSCTRRGGPVRGPASFR